MKRRFRQAILLPLVLLILLACLLTAQIFHQRGVALATDATDRIISKLNQVQTLFIDLETGFRGYLLGQDEVFLEPYQKALGTAQGSLGEVKGALSSQPSELPKVERLQESVIAWMTYAQQEINRHQQSHSRLAPYKDFEGKRQMDGIRDQVRSLIADQEDLRKSLSSRWEVTLRYTLFVIFGLTLLTGVFIGYFTFEQIRRIERNFGASLDEFRKEREQYRAIFDGVRDHGILLMTPQGKIERWNAGAERITGYTSDDAIGNSADFMRPPGEASRLPQLLRTAQLEGRAESEAWRLKKDGSRFWIDVVVTALFTASGELRGFSSVFRDYSKRKRVEEERSSLLKKLEEAVQSRDEFLSLASHELKTPLTATSLQLQTLRRQRQKRDPSAEFSQVRVEVLDSFERQIDRIAGLVNRMLELARLHSGSLTYDFKSTDISELVRNLAESFKQQFEEAGSQFTLTVEEGVTGHWDPFRLEQILVNLLANALKYGQGHPVEVSVSRKEEDMAQITVRDHGIGIPKQHQARVFEKFGKVSGDSDSGGLGLGLYISQQIAHAHGGSIRLSSEPGSGASFTLELPCE